MLKNFKNKDFITTLCFVLIIFTIFFACILSPKEEISLSERRPLDQFPEFTWERLWNGKFFEDFEGFSSDQLVLREPLRNLKAKLRYNVLQRLENNGIYIKDGNAIKIDNELNESLITSNVLIWQKVVNRYFKEANLYYSIIPDKNYYAAGKFYPQLDYDKFNSVVSANKPSKAKEIDVSDLLELEDFYKTDLHWDQSLIVDIAEKVANAMGTTVDGLDKYTKEFVEDFYGAYYRQSALPLAPDKITLLHSEVLDSAKVYYWQLVGGQYQKVEGDLYPESGKTSADMYDVFLSGIQPIVEIENTLEKNGKTLVLFRDSFGSSFAPLLLSGYERVVMIDTRAIMSDMLGMINGLDLSATDVLFMYSTTALNSAIMR